MAQYSIDCDICLGMSHSGRVNTEGESTVELSDDEVKVLVDLIREKDTTDVEELGIEESHPELYEKLREAYYHMAYRAEEMHWLWEGFESGYFEYDEEELMKYCKENCNFEFEYDEEDYKDEDGNIDEDDLADDEQYAFNDWLDDYVHGLSDGDARDFFYDHMNAQLDLEDIDYEVCIPEAIIKMARE